MLPLLSAILVAFALGAYVLLDGYDLGVGFLLLTTRDESVRDVMVESIAPTWDGNETWIILSGVALLAAFPAAYSVLMPALYVPLFVMLLAMGCRGVAFEFRVQPGAWRTFWDLAFGIGSLTAALVQGIVLGALLQGLDLTGDRFNGRWTDAFSLFSLLTGTTLLAGYAVLGAGWLYWKTDGELQSAIARRLRIALPFFVVLASISCLAAATVQTGISTTWHEHAVLLAFLSAVFSGLGFLVWTAAGKRPHRNPFLFGLGMFATALAGLSIAVFPNIVPFRISLWAAAAPAASHLFLLIGTGLLLPVTLAYSAYALWIFRGKVSFESASFPGSRERSESPVEKFDSLNRRRN